MFHTHILLFSISRDSDICIIASASFVYDTCVMDICNVSSRTISDLSIEFFNVALLSCSAFRQTRRQFDSLFASWYASASLIFVYHHREKCSFSIRLLLYHVPMRLVYITSQTNVFRASGYKSKSASVRIQVIEDVAGEFTARKIYTREKERRKESR